MNKYKWYKIVDSDTSIDQGDLIDRCPVISINPEVSEDLLTDANEEALDCVVMTQACDLEQAHVREVILCPYYNLSTYKPDWEEVQKVANQNPTPKAWKNFLNDVKNGRIWNLAMLNSFVSDDGEEYEIRIVDFHEIFSVPRVFLETWLQEHGTQRLTLLPPYREYLSQAFARYFMRVGLPMDISPVWDSN